MEEAVQIPLAERVRIASRAVQMGAPIVKSAWPKVFYNKTTKRPYIPNTPEVKHFIESDLPRRFLLKGGEGSGKSAAGIIKTFGRLRRGCNGAMLSTDFPQLIKSLLPQFKEWCPEDAVIESQRHCLSPTWKPGGFFTLHFYNELGSISELFIGGIEDPFSWRGGNLNFVHLDEAERHNTPDALKVLDGRIRMQSDGQPPCQIWLTTTPRKHWLYDYFYGTDFDEEIPKDDKLREWKEESETITVRTIDNERNLEKGYVKRRTAGLSAAEARVLMDAKWEDVSDQNPYIPNIMMWDNCKEEKLSDPTKQDYLVVALDGATSHDSFGLVAVSPHPDPDKAGAVAVQAAHAWDPRIVGSEYLLMDKSLNFEMIERDIRALISGWNVVKLVYDPRELHYMASNLSDVVYTEVFSQNELRNIADKHLLDMILQRRIAHRGDEILRKHLFNANRKLDGDRKIRIVKRENSLKIDVAVCLSMATYAVMEYVPDSNTGYVATGSNAVSGNVIETLAALARGRNP